MTASSPLELPGVTLCCVDTRNHALALRALTKSQEGVRFARTILLTDALPVGVAARAGIDIVAIPDVPSRDAYSEFVLKSLLPHVATEHVLLVQWDGYVVNPAAWDSDFLACDYIGAKWFWAAAGRRVGNGGFSLRSRKLLPALQDPRIHLVDGEDATIGRAFRPLLEHEHGIRFADEALADRFSFEAGYPIGKPFGFHGLFNFCRTVPAAEIAALARGFSDAIARSPQLASLARNCSAYGMWEAVVAIARRMLEAMPGHTEATSLLAQAESNLARPPVVGRNEPCPCGSGRKYKQCHGALGRDGAVARDGTPAVGAGAPPAEPLNPDARVAAALAQHQRGDHASAEREYRAVLQVAPDHPTALHYLGVILYQRRELDAALPLLMRSTQAVPGEPEFHNNLGLALAAADRTDEAIAAYRRALALNPDHSVAWNNLGLALQERNDSAGAIAAFRRAIEIDPEFARAHWNLSLALLEDGQFREGFREYEWRLAIDELGKGRHPLRGPVWDGKSPGGKALLVHTEQGLGDALQFARYATLLAAQGARVLIQCTLPLRNLLATVPGVAAAFGPGEPLPHYDAHIALLSLPRIFGTDAASIPASVPYLTVPAEQRAAVRASLASNAPALRVGIAWAGSKAHANDRNRSLPLAMLAPLFEIPGIHWHSLQLGADDEIARTPTASRMVRLPSDTALDDTAALISEIDLVVSVDTSIAHLAGALARPLWVMLPFAPDWRWRLGSDRSPWYPTARLFRQTAPRAWPEVVARIREALVARVADTASGR
jgi:tetratricopeptide (TPR) repeat protein